MLHLDVASGGSVPFIQRAYWDFQYIPITSSQGHSFLHANGHGIISAIIDVITLFSHPPDTRSAFEDTLEPAISDYDLQPSRAPSPSQHSERCMSDYDMLYSPTPSAFTILDDELDDDKYSVISYPSSTEDSDTSCLVRYTSAGGSADLESHEDQMVIIGSNIRSVAVNIFNGDHYHGPIHGGNVGGRHNNNTSKQLPSILPSTQACSLTYMYYFSSRRE